MEKSKEELRTMTWSELQKFDKQRKREERVRMRSIADNPNNPICKCGWGMVVRVNKIHDTKFYGCTRFPNCRETKDINAPTMAL